MSGQFDTPVAKTGNTRPAWMHVRGLVYYIQLDYYSSSKFTIEYEYTVIVFNPV